MVGFGIYYAFCLLCIVMSLVIMWRTNKVGRYRQTLIYKIHDAALDDIAHGRDPMWRWRAFDGVSFNDMVFKFWRPLDSFYVDMGFAEKVVERAERRAPSAVLAGERWH